ncbi:hypothetical protein R6Q59_024003 [Mikania micrantha]
MSGLSVNESDSSPSQNETTQKESLETMFSDSTVKFNPQMNDVLSNMLQFQGHGVNPNPMFPMMLNPMAFSSQQINNYAAMSNLFAQQQFLSTMNSLQSQNLGPASSSSALPDIFNSIISSQTPTSTMNGSKKDDTKAFDFISSAFRVLRQRNSGFYDEYALELLRKSAPFNVSSEASACPTWTVASPTDAMECLTLPPLCTSGSTTMCRERVEKMSKKDTVCEKDVLELKRLERMHVKRIGKKLM